MTVRTPDGMGGFRPVRQESLPYMQPILEKLSILTDIPFFLKEKKKLSKSFSPGTIELIFKPLGVMPLG
ncbi:MAG: hypothetical protein KDD19_11750 [Phaeodactylibacter sp.]|nr:hypothetical protein [Phaeodactylibacter sp.]